MSVGALRPTVLGVPLGVPAPPAAPGVCATCHGPARDGRAHCWCCRSVARTLDVDTLGLVVPMALFEAGDRLHAVLRGYKDANAGAARRRHTRVLAGHIDRFVAAHAGCIERAAGPWDAVAVVPSSRRVSGRLAVRAVAHPLSAVVAAVPALSGVSPVVLGPGCTAAGHLAPDRQAFLAPASAVGRRVLLVDDTWVTGAHMASAAVALRGAGATVVAMVVAGRMVRRRPPGGDGVAPVHPPCCLGCARPDRARRLARPREARAVRGP